MASVPTAANMVAVSTKEGNIPKTQHNVIHTVGSWVGFGVDMSNSLSILLGIETCKNRIPTMKKLPMATIAVTPALGISLYLYESAITSPLCVRILVSK